MIPKGGLKGNIIPERLSLDGEFRKVFEETAACYPTLQVVHHTVYFYSSC